MVYLEYLTLFNQYQEFNTLVSAQSKVLDFSNKDCQEALQKWILDWSNLRFNQLQELFKSRTGPKEDVVLIKAILRDADFLRTYLETFGVSFLNTYCGYSKALNKVQSYIQECPILQYSTIYNNLGKKVWSIENKEIDAVDLNKILEEKIHVDLLFVPLLTLVWSQTPIKQMIISAYIKKSNSHL